MDRQLIEKVLEVLTLHKDIENIANELQVRIPKENQIVVHDLISELELISLSLAILEKDVYIENLRNEINEIENNNNNKTYEFEDLQMIVNLYKEDPKQITPKLMDYVFEVLNKILEKE